MTTQQVKANITALNTVIHLQDALTHLNAYYNREQDRKLTADDAASSIRVAFAAFVTLLESDGWRKFGNDGLGYIHDTDGRIEMRNISGDGYAVLQHAHVSYFPDYRNPYEETADLDVHLHHQHI
jgi:hypothetical protein